MASEHRIVFFDFETGGVDADHPNIQLAAVATEGLVEVDAFEAKIAFDEADADPGALAMNHYDPGVWRREAKPERVVLLQFARFLEEHATIAKTSKRGKPYRVAWPAGHNIVSFDLPRLKTAFERHEQFLAMDLYRPLDTLHLALWHASATNSYATSFKLADVCERFGIASAGAHDALADVRMCVELTRVLQRGMARACPPARRSRPPMRRTA